MPENTQLVDTVASPSVERTPPRPGASRVAPGLEVLTLPANRPRFDGRPFESVRISTNKLSALHSDGIRPIWTPDRLPVQVLTPLDPAVVPLVVDTYVLRPDYTNGIVYVAPRHVALLDFSLTVRRDLRADGSIAISGASAVFSITVHEARPLEEVAILRQHWATAIKARPQQLEAVDEPLRRDLAGVKVDRIQRDWSYQPEPRRGLTVSLELPPGVAASPPLVVTSALAGVATVAVELTEQGALSWRAALEQGDGGSVPGVLHVDTSVPAVDEVALRLDRRTLDTSVGSLLAGRGQADIHYVDPQLTVQGRLLVITSEFVARSTVGVRPNQGQPPVSQVFEAAGGQLEVSVTTQDVPAVVMDWSAQVSFTPLGWPAVPAAGRLDASNVWTDIIKPESWCASYLVMAIPVDDRGQATTLEPGSPSELQGVLNFTAPYVGNGLLNNSFHAPYLSPVNVALPRYPGQPFGELVLTVFATRNGRGGTISRRLAEDELNVVVLVHPDAHVEIRTPRDQLPEVSTAAEQLDLLQAVN